VSRKFTADVLSEINRGLMAHLPDGVLAGLTREQKQAVVKLMARISEASYRRGAQQGVTFQRDRAADLPISMASWRYDTRQDISPWLDSNMVENAEDRLMREYRPALREAGLL